MNYDRALYRAILNHLTEQVEQSRMCIHTSSMHLSANQEEVSVYYFNQYVGELRNTLNKIEEFFNQDALLKLKKVEDQS